MLQLAQVSLYWVIRIIQPLLVPICFVCAWAILLLIAWSVGAAIRDSIQQAKRMHQIPCANCRFFTGDYHLKCPVHPKQALSQEAINCRDYEAATQWGIPNLE